MDTEKQKRFTCLDEDGEIVVVRAESPADADKEVRADLIVEGTLKAIGAKRINEAPEGAIWAVNSKLEKNTVCTLIVGDPMMVANATFLGDEEIDGNAFLAWQRNGVRFWTFKWNTQLTYVGGQKIGTESD